MVYLPVDTEVHILFLHAVYIQSDWLREGGGSPQLFLNNGSVLRPEDTRVLIPRYSCFLSHLA